MKKLSIPTLTLLFLIALAACAGASGSETPTGTAQDGWVLVGNYGLEDQNRLTLAAEAANIEYKLDAPTGEGCLRAEDCLWNPGDQAFYIRKGTEGLLWLALDAVCKQEGITTEVCTPQDD